MQDPSDWHPENGRDLLRGRQGDISFIRQDVVNCGPGNPCYLSQFGLTGTGIVDGPTVRTDGVTFHQRLKVSAYLESVCHLSPPPAVQVFRPIP